MHEILIRLTPRDRVLDLGCARGSFPSEHTAARVVRADLEPRTPGAVACDARRLPFAPHSFSAAILNHSLEHFEQPDLVLAELRRVVDPAGYLYIAVPDASTLCDRVYRWLGRGGGHVNPFTDAEGLAAHISRATGFPHRGTRVLHTSFSFLNRRNIPGRPPRRLLPLGGGNESVLRLASRAFRAMDRHLGTRLAVYGWAFWFGAPLEIDPTARTNVCVRCGAGHRSDLVVRQGRRRYQCPCGAWNYFTADQ